MLKLNTDEKRQLSFEINIQGINHKELQGSLKFIIDGIDYGFPVKILQDHISVDVPPLDSVIKKGLTDNKIIECKLDIFGNGFYLKPWESKFTLKTPVKMEAKMRLEDDIPYTPISEKEDKKIIKATLKEETKIPKEKEIEINNNPSLNDHTTKQLIEILMSKLDKKPINKRKIQKVKEDTKKELVERKVKSKLSKISSLVDEALIRKTKIKKSNLNENKKIKNTKKITSRPKIKKDPHIQLMESYGFKNPKSQKRLMERVIDIGGNDHDAIQSTIKKLLGPFQSQKTSFQQYLDKKENELNDK